MENFLSHTYVLHPVFLAFNNSIESGAYRIRDLLPKHYEAKIESANLEIEIDEDETLGYLTPGWPHGQECLSLLVTLPDKQMIEVGLLRQSEVGFSNREHCQLQTLFPIVKALFQKNYSLMSYEFSTISKQPSLMHVFNMFGSDILTQRESEVVKLILTGHSGMAISLKMGTSLATAKTHRRNIYSKFNISSQAELFNRFINFLSEQSLQQ